MGTHVCWKQARLNMMWKQNRSNARKLRYLELTGSLAPQVKKARNQSQIFNRKSHNTTHRQSYHLQAMLTGLKCWKAKIRSEKINNHKTAMKKTAQIHLRQIKQYVLLNNSRTDNAVLCEINFLLKFVIDSLHLTPVEWIYFNTDMCKFESSQKDEGRAQSADSSKACRKLELLFVLAGSHDSYLLRLASHSEKFVHPWSLDNNNNVFFQTHGPYHSHNQTTQEHKKNG